MGAGCGMYFSKRESNGNSCAPFSPGGIEWTRASAAGLICAPGRDAPHDGQIVLCSVNALPQCVHTIISRFFPVLYGAPLYCFLSMLYHSVSCIALYCPVLTMTGNFDSTCLRRLVYLPCSADRLERSQDAACACFALFRADRGRRNDEQGGMNSL